MPILNLLLSGEVLLFVAGCVSLVILVRGLTGFSGQAPALRLRLINAEQELAKLRDGLPERRQAVEKIRADLQPLKQEHAIMLSYYKKLLQVESTAISEAAEADEKPAKGDIKIHKRGFPGL
jgi:hypothetical protein